MKGIHASPRSKRHTYLAKVAAAAALLAVSDLVFVGYGGGSVVAIFALAWLAALAITRPAILRARYGWAAMAAAMAFALVLADDPSLLTVVLFLAAIGSAALLPRHAFDHAGRWMVRLSMLAVKGVARAPLDWLLISRRPTRGGVNSRAILLHVALPVIGGGVFLALFASANPILGNAFATIRMPGFTTLFFHAIVLIATLSLVWPTFRPQTARFDTARAPRSAAFPELPATALVPALIVFNAVFALGNVLDLLFLWSGAPLPSDVTLAEYAHRGAYTLIVTALLAAAFVLIALRPGSPASNNSLVRGLVLLWVAQNILLIASSALRLLDYIDAYSLTVLRISALAWMALVAVGLALICWRFLAGQSASWLINTNALSGLIVLSIASVVDLGAVSASWNVRHTRDPARLDLCYIRSLGPSALLPVIELRDNALDPKMQDRAIYVSERLHDQLRADQADWQSWTFRGARRLAQADDMLAGDRRVAKAASDGRGCDGRMLEPPPPIYTPPIEEPTAQPIHITPGLETTAPIMPDGTAPEVLTPGENP